MAVAGPTGSNRNWCLKRGPERVTAKTYEDGGYLDLHNWRRRVFIPACKRAGVKVTLYELRHTFCSLLAHEGRSPVYIAAAMGHSLIETQSRYSHIIEDARLSPGKPMAEAIYEARVELAESGASSVCLSDPPTVLRRALGSF